LFVLCIEIHHDRKHSLPQLSQRAYIRRVLEKFGMKC